MVSQSERNNNETEKLYNNRQASNPHRTKGRTILCECTQVLYRQYLGTPAASDMSDNSIGEHAPPGSVSASSELPSSRNDDGTIGSPPRSDEMSPAQIEAQADGTNSPVQARAGTVAVQREVRTLQVDYEERLSDMPPMTLPPAMIERVEGSDAIVVEPCHQVVVSGPSSSSSGERATTASMPAAVLKPQPDRTMHYDGGDKKSKLP